MQEKKQVEQPTLNPTFSEYWAKGMSVIPERNGIPTFAWSSIYRDNYKPTAEELLEWDLEIDYNFGLVTGSCSGIVCVDLDYVTEAEQQRAIELLGKTPCAKKGSKGLTLFYKYNNERNCNWIKDNIVKAELLSTGRKTTVPPSIHRKTGKPYKWVGTPLIECYDKLPTLPANYQELLDSLFSIIRAPEREYQRSDFDFKPSYNDAVTALNYCDPNCSNADWIALGMAFRAEVGDAGFDDFNAWSSKGKSYDKGSIRSRWRSFNSHSISYGTLIHFAKEGGYVPPQRERTVIAEKVSIEDWEKSKLETKLVAIETSGELPSFYTEAPHHIKEVCEWIVNTSLYPQPTITLGSVLGFFGFLMGKDFEFNSIRTNLYVANIAYSADGKEHVNRCVRGLLASADILEHISYGFTSDTSILKDLQKNAGRTFYLTDELQSLLYSISKRSSNSAEGRAVSILLQAYTGVEVRTVTKADTKENPVVIVKNPLVTICGYTTPHMFESCLGSTEVLSGFVGRLSTFRGNKYIPEENDNFNGNAWKNVPDNIVQIIKDIQSNSHREFLPDGAFVYGTKEIPTKCLDLIKDYRKQIKDKRNEMRANNNPLEVIFGRAAEVMIKYAMIASKGKEILPEHIDWAIKVVEYNLSIICDIAENFADTDFERKKMQLLNFIKVHGKVDKTTINNNFKKFSSVREREEALNDLVKSELLDEIKITGGAREKLGYKPRNPLASI